MKINCIIQARMGSERFPGKVFATWKWHEPLFVNIARRCGGAAVDKVILAIPAGSLDDELAKEAKSRWLCVVRSAERNVAKRFKKVLNEHPCDGFVRVCADSPFIMPELISAVANRLRAGDPFCYVKGAPGGQQPQACRTDVFREAYPDFTEDEHEHVLIGLQRKYRDYFIDASNMCVDTPEDLERLREWL